MNPGAMTVPTAASLRRTRRRRLPGNTSWMQPKHSYILVVTVFIIYACTRRSVIFSVIPLNQPSIAADSSAVNNESPQCAFREYPPRRYYGWNQSVHPDFLENAEYIYGERPIMLTTNELRLQKGHGKLCVDQSEWQPANEPNFADGTNPSLILLERMKNHPLYTHFKQLGAKYLGTLCLTNSQCSWKDTPEEKKAFGISDRSDPFTLRTVLLLLDANFRTLQQTTILLERDAKWSKKTPLATNADGTFQKEPRAFDDARLFIHANDQVWVSFREGKDFGYDRQVIMEVKMELPEGGKKFTATVSASKTASFCCGRNMALMKSEVRPSNMLQTCR